MNTEYPEKYTTLGLKIAYYRKKAGYTQETFAEKIGKSVKITSADFFHRLFIEKAFYLFRKTLFLFIVLFVCHAVKFAQLILLRF